ncbi:MAG: hypothetical protein IKI51_04220, partial [Clostridia bacterium]|nr:hypothetical protein [Clostridia bacterium]
MNILCERIRALSEYGQIRKGLMSSRGRARRYPSMITGLSEGAVDAFLAALTSDEKGDSPALVIVPDEKTAQTISDALVALGLKAEIFPARDPVLYNMVSSHESEHERISVLMDIQKSSVDAVISTCNAALGYTVPPTVLSENELVLEVGKEYSLDALRAFLVKAGYVMSDLVDGRGQFSVRGGILDVFPPHLEQPVRAEFFGDEIDQMGYFDTFTQRKTEQIQMYEITPAREILITKERQLAVANIIKKLVKKAEGETLASLRRELDVIENETDIPFADKYISAVYPERVCLLDYFGDDALVFALDIPSITERLKAISWHMSETVTSLIEGGLLAPECTDFSKDDGALFAFIDSRSALIINSFSAGYQGKLTELYSFKTRTPPAFSGNFDALFDDVRMYTLSGAAVLVACGSEGEAFSLCELLSERGLRAVPYKDYGDIAEIPGGSVAAAAVSARGFELIGSAFVCFAINGDREKRRSTYRRRVKDKKTAKEKLMSYADLTVGDYVVHTVHGIGKYLGLESVLTYDGVRSDHIKIQYAGTGILYVPCEKIDSVSKYIGASTEGAEIKLSKLGGGEWERTKSRVKSEVRSMAKELIALYAERLRKPGFACLPDDDMQREFESMFEYEETDGQLAAAR